MRCFINYLFFIIFYSPFSNGNNITRQSKPRVFFRFLEQNVADRLYNFLNDNNIDNCYQFQENENHLLLICWGDYWGIKQLFEVDIIVHKEYLKTNNLRTR